MKNKRCPLNMVSYCYEGFAPISDTESLIAPHIHLYLKVFYDLPTNKIRNFKLSQINLYV